MVWIEPASPCSDALTAARRDTSAQALWQKADWFPRSPLEPLLSFDSAVDGFDIARCTPADGSGGGPQVGEMPLGIGHNLDAGFCVAFLFRNDPVGDAFDLVHQHLDLCVRGQRATVLLGETRASASCYGRLSECPPTPPAGTIARKNSRTRSSGARARPQRAIWRRDSRAQFCLVHRGHEFQNLGLRQEPAGRSGVGSAGQRSHPRDQIWPEMKYDDSQLGASEPGQLRRFAVSSLYGDHHVSWCHGSHVLLYSLQCTGSTPPAGGTGIFSERSTTKAVTAPNTN